MHIIVGLLVSRQTFVYRRHVSTVCGQKARRTAARVVFFWCITFAVKSSDHWNMTIQQTLISMEHRSLADHTKISKVLKPMKRLMMYRMKIAQGIFGFNMQYKHDAKQANNLQPLT